jgi:hypothetical protein
MQALTFKQQLVLTLLDKGLLALLILLAAFVINRALERFKAKQTVKTETTKARIQAMNQTWGEITAWRASALTKSDRYQSDDQWAESKKQIKAGFDNTFQIIERNRFMCGNEFADAAMTYAANLMQYFQDYVFTGQIDSTGEYARLRQLSQDIVGVEKFLQ